MSKRSKKGHRSPANLQGYVVVAFAEDLEQAREYKTLLEVNDVAAIISERQDPSVGSKEIAVMVPEDCLDEAHVIIESQQAYQAAARYLSTMSSVLDELLDLAR